MTYPTPPLFYIFKLVYHFSLILSYTSTWQVKEYMREWRPDIIAYGCMAHYMNLVGSDLSKHRGWSYLYRKAKTILMLNIITKKMKESYTCFRNKIKLRKNIKHICMSYIRKMGVYTKREYTCWRPFIICVLCILRGS